MFASIFHISHHFFSIDLYGDSHIIFYGKSILKLAPIFISRGDNSTSFFLIFSNFVFLMHFGRPLAAFWLLFAAYCFLLVFSGRLFAPSDSFSASFCPVAASFWIHLAPDDHVFGHLPRKNSLLETFLWISVQSSIHFTLICSS